MSLLASLAVVWAYGIAQPADLVAVAAVVAAAVLALAVAARRLLRPAMAAGRLAAWPSALRQVRSTGHPPVRQSDPDARGHHRPRAPSALPSAA